jgi:autotransporter-associated beta strand protein
LTKLGAGRLVMAGSYDNDHKGVTTVSQGVLQLSKSNSVAIVAPLNIGDPTNAANTRVVSLTASNQIANSVDVTVNASGRLDLNSTIGLYDAIGSLSGEGSVNLGFGGSLSVGTNNASTTFIGSLTGWGGTFTKEGTGTLTLSGNNVSFLGYIAVASGELSVNGDSSSCEFIVYNGGMLDGSGFTGTVINGGQLSPGNSPGVLTTKDASFGPGSTYTVQLNGTVAGLNYDQLNVFGAVTLSNVTLNATLGFAGALSNQFVIIQNDSTDAVNGTFNGLAEGAVFAIGGAPFQITYKGGQGSNDVVLTQIGLPTPPQISGITSQPNGQIQLTGTGIPNSSYTVLANNDLNTTNWIALGVIVAGQNGVMAFTDTDAPNHSMRFYRFRAN